MCCVTLDLSAILKDGPIKQYYVCILREPVIPMSYDLHIVEADVEIQMFGGNDLKLAFRYSVKDRVGQFKHWFIDFKIMPQHIENSQMFFHNHPTSSNIHCNCTAL